MKKFMEVLVIIFFLVGAVFALENRANESLQKDENTTIQVIENQETQEEVMENKKEGGFFEKIVYFFKCAFSDMKESAKAQHEVDKANFEAAKAEAKANFEENRFHNSLERAKQNSKESWENAKAMSNSETRKAMEQKKRDEAIKAANERKAAAEKRYEEAKK